MPDNTQPQPSPIQRPIASPYDFTRDPITRRRILTQQRVLYQSFGDHNYVVEVGGNIQVAINRLQANGGGILRLGDGTHDLSTYSLTFPAKTPIQILGINMTTTILDFGSTTNNISFTASYYTTGTVTISSGVTVTGSSTAWLSSGLVAGDQIFLDSRWYKIAAITGNTSIILAEGYGGSALAGATYKAASICSDIEFTELTIKSSTNTNGALAFNGLRNAILDDVTFALNYKNGVITNFSEWSAGRIVSASATSDGFTFNTGTFCNNQQFASVGNGNDAFVLTSVMAGTFLFCAANGNTANGFTITSCTNMDFVSVEANGNGAKGFEGVSGNTNLKFNLCDALFNVSDNYKLTASSDECRFTSCRAKSSISGYGINIADSTCDNNIISDCIILSNASGQVSDSGTGTLINNNVGV